MAFNRLPRAVRGRPVSAEDWNALCDAIEQCRVMPSAGAEVKTSAAGTHITPVLQPIARVAVVTTVVPKMVGATPGVGKGTIQVLVAGVYQPSAQTGVDLYSILTDKQINVGAYVKATRTDNVWLVDTVDSCAHLAASAGPAPPPPVRPAAASAAPTLSPASPEVLGVGGVTPRFTFAHGSPVRGGF